MGLKRVSRVTINTPNFLFFTWIRNIQFAILAIEGRSLVTLRQSACNDIKNCLIEAAHEIMALFVLRKLILQTRMCSHPVGLDVWFFVGSFVYFHTSCVQTAKALARLRRCAGLPEPSLDAYVVSTIISWAGSINCLPYIFAIKIHEVFVCFVISSKPSNLTLREKRSKSDTFQILYVKWLSQWTHITSILGLATARVVKMIEIFCQRH